MCNGEAQTMLKKLLAALTLLAATAAHAQPAHVDALIEGMRGGGEEALVHARQMLPRTGSAHESAPKLATLISHPDARVWHTAVQILSDIAHETAAPGREVERAAVADALLALLGPEHTPHEKEQALRLLPVAVPEGHDLAPLAAVLAGEDEVLAEKARAALLETGTPDAAAVLRLHLREAAPPMQAAILDALAAMGDRTSYNPAVHLMGYGRGLTVHWPSESPEVRIAAAHLLATSGDFLYLLSMQRLHTDSTGDLALEATRALLMFLNNMIERGGHWEVGMREIERLARVTEDPVLRGAALVSLGKYGDERSIPLIIELAGADALLHGPALAGLKYQQGRAAESALRQAAEDAPEALGAGISGMLARREQATGADAAPEPEAEAQERHGVLRHWVITEPFPWKQEDGFALELLALVPETFADRGLAEGPGVVDLHGKFAGPAHVAAFARTTVVVPEPMEAMLLLGSDDGVGVWINGELVHENEVDRGLALDQDRVPVSLHAGKNEILLQITQYEGGWAFAARLTAPDGGPLEFEEVQPGTGGES